MPSGYLRGFLETFSRSWLGRSSLGWAEYRELEGAFVVAMSRVVIVGEYMKKGFLTDLQDLQQKVFSSDLSIQSQFESYIAGLGELLMLIAKRQTRRRKHVFAEVNTSMSGLTGLSAGYELRSSHAPRSSLLYAEHRTLEEVSLQLARIDHQLTANARDAAALVDIYHQLDVPKKRKEGRELDELFARNRRKCAFLLRKIHYYDSENTDLYMYNGHVKSLADLFEARVGEYTAIFETIYNHDVRGDLVQRWEQKLREKRISLGETICLGAYYSTSPPTDEPMLSKLEALQSYCETHQLFIPSDGSTDFHRAALASTESFFDYCLFSTILTLLFAGVGQPGRLEKLTPLAVVGNILTVGLSLAIFMGLMLFLLERRERGKSARRSLFALIMLVVVLLGGVVLGEAYLSGQLKIVACLLVLTVIPLYTVWRIVDGISDWFACEGLL